jgi:integral membrane sensor domain MASE1
MNTYAYSVYMPHGLRILFFLIYGFWSIPGLLLAHMITSLGTDFVTSLNEIFSLIIATFCVPLSALFLTRFFKEIKNKFNLEYLFFLTLISTFINGFFTNLVRYFLVFKRNLSMFFEEITGYFVGDILGVILIILSYLIIKRLFLISIS